MFSTKVVTIDPCSEDKWSLSWDDPFVSSFLSTWASSLTFFCSVPGPYLWANLSSSVAVFWSRACGNWLRAGDILAVYKGWSFATAGPCDEASEISFGLDVLPNGDILRPFLKQRIYHHFGLLFLHDSKGQRPPSFPGASCWPEAVDLYLRQ